MQSQLSVNEDYDITESVNLKHLITENETEDYGNILHGTFA